MTRRRLPLLPSGLAFVFLALVAFVACGGGGGSSSPTPQSTPTAAASVASPVPPTAAAPSSYCRPPTGQFPAENYRVQLEARWKGDRVIIEGTAAIPGPGDVRYYVCQNGQVATFLRPIKEPTLEGGKINAESQVMKGMEAGLDPNGQFEAVVAVVGVTGVPFFITGVPVEGRPE